MPGQRKLEVIISGDSRRLESAFGKASKSAKGFGSKMAGVGKVAGLALAGGVAGAAVLAKGFVDAAIESQKVTKQTEAVIKSTGAAAGVTAKQVGDLSTALSLKSGVDDEVIQSGENVLLTFTGIRNGLGKNEKVFDDATAAALDMSTALGTDMTSASMMIGKALNDPVKGIAKLTRSGVVFTDQQKKQITALAESGDVMGAQKIMLAELNKEFGGSAAAQATASDKLKVAWGNVQEELGAQLLPVVEKVATFLAKNLPGAVDTLKRALGPVISTLQSFFYTLTSGFTEDEGTPVERFALKVREVFQQVQEVVRRVWPDVQRIVTQVITTIGTVVREVWPDVQRIITQVITTVSTVVSGAVSAILVLWNNFGNNILSFVQRVWPNVQQVISAALTVIRGVVEFVLAVIQGKWGKAWDALKSIVSGVWNAIQGIVKAALEALRGVLGIGLEVVGSMFKGAWKGVTDLVREKIGAVVGMFGGIGGKIKTALFGLASILTAPYRAAFNAVAGFWNKTVGKLSFKAPKWIPGIGGKGWDVPDIPTLHTGGIFDSGRGEGLARLADGEGVFTPDQMAALGAIRPARTAAPSVIVNVRVDGSMLGTPRELIALVNDGVRRGLKLETAR